MTPLVRTIARGLLGGGLLLAAPGCDASLSTGVDGLRGPVTFSVREIAGESPGNLGADPVIAVLLEYEPLREGSGCAGLDVELGVSQTVVTVHILGLRQAVCDPGANSVNTCACALVTLPRLVGLFELRIATDERIDRYTLSVSADAIEIEPLHAQFTEPRFTRAWRFPPNSMAVVCYTGTANTEACSAFDARLAAEPGFSAFAFPAGGEIPFPRTETIFGGAVYRASYFRYADEGRYSRAAALLREFAPGFEAANPDAFIYLVNWRGVFAQ